MKKKNIKYQDKSLDKFLNEYYQICQPDIIGKYREASRLSQLNMEPYSSLKNKIAKTSIEKDSVLKLILSQIKQYKISEQLLEDKSRELGNKLIKNCSDCEKRYRTCCDENGTNKLTWNKYFETNYYDFCSPNPDNCKNASLITKDLSLNTIINERQKLIVEHKNLEIGYKVALEQQGNLVELYKTLISRYRENNAILIFKKNDIQRKINYIQLSVIFISAIITLFETIKPTISQYMSESILMIFPIALSTYIGLILAIGRFFKFDTKNEQIIKLIEKYSFIINKFVQKKDKAANFDFKFKNVKKWDELLEIEEKDNITDIILKASEERDIILTPKEHVFYKKKYTKIYLKEMMESINLNTLSYLVGNTDNQDKNINKLVQNIVIKEPFFKYYFCCLWCCKHREYVDYEKVMLKEAATMTKEEIATLINSWNSTANQKIIETKMKEEEKNNIHDEDLKTKSKKSEIKDEEEKKNIGHEEVLEMKSKKSEKKKDEEEEKVLMEIIENNILNKLMNVVDAKISLEKNILMRNQVLKRPHTTIDISNPDIFQFKSKWLDDRSKDLSNNATLPNVVLCDDDDDEDLYN